MNWIREWFRRVLYAVRWFFFFLNRPTWMEEDFYLDILNEQLRLLQINIEHDDIHTGAEKVAREIAITRSHIAHYQDLENFRDLPEREVELEKSDDGRTLIMPKFSEEYRQKLIEHVQLEKWHWHQIWQRIAKTGRGWWM